LSSREIEVLQLIAAGNANKEIAGKLCIAEETVKSTSRIPSQSFTLTTALTLSPPR